MSLSHLRSKLRRHPVLGKARVWAWVAPGNVPDPIVLAVTAARLRGAELILKLSRRNERTGRALVRRHAAKGQKVRIAVRHADFKRLAARADAWVVYGSDATLEALRRDAPAGAGWVGHGHRISLSVVFRSCSRTAAAVVRTAKACARDIRPHDQLGCLSPQIIWVEGDPAPFASALRRELGRLEAAKGRARRDPETLRMRRAALAELRVRALDPDELELLPPASDRAGVRPSDEPQVYLLKRGAFLTPAGAQIVAVKSFRSAADIRRGMGPFLKHLQGVAAAGTPAERRTVRKVFAGTSAVYFPRVGSLQTPPIDWQI